MKDYLKEIEDLKSHPGTVSALGQAFALASQSIDIETAVDASNEVVQTTVDVIDTAATVIDGAATVVDITTTFLL